MENEIINDSSILDPEKMYEELVQAILEGSIKMDLGRVRSAYEFSVEKHKNQKRRDGSPYVTHSIATAKIIVGLGLDEDSVVAALLHDVLEDTSTSYDEVKKLFGVLVADIVDGVTKLTRVQYTSQEDEQSENLRKMLIAMAKDIRVILIKMSDRLHNMRTMDYQSPEKQLKKSAETMEIYAPIAHRLGMQRIKWELEDRALYYLDRTGYNEIMQSLSDKMDILKEFMSRIESQIEGRIRKEEINANVYGRIKHIYSIYRKMYSQRLDLNNIYDLCAFRVVVNDISDCYNSLGLIHDMFKPMPRRFKDYISTPKPNGYQSLHTTVIGTEGIPFEVQIRTWDMHRTAEYGVAAHWKYKTGAEEAKPGDEEKFAWIRRLLEAQQESDAQEFVHELKIDLFSDEVFVFTPKGDVINLPAGSTPIDFAYAIHSDIGNSMVGAKVNRRIVNFDHILENGDIVEIRTSKSSSGPSRDWLKIARSSGARTKIKQWFKREKRDENIARGKAMLEAELAVKNIAPADWMNEEMLPNILKRLSISDLNDIYAAIGYGGQTALRTANRIKDEVARFEKHEKKTVLDKISEQAERRSKRETKPQQEVLIEGLDNCLIKFSKCCTPVPGDEIVGFITRGQGVSLHRTDCRNYLKQRISSLDGGRWIEAEWAENNKDYYQTTLRILAKERSGLVMDIATVLNSLNAKVRSLNARDVGNGNSTANIILEVKDVKELRKIMDKLSAIKDIVEVQRAGA